MADQDISTQWKSLSADQRTLAMSKMTPEQKAKLASSLGYKEKVAETPGAVFRPMTEREQLETVYPVGARGETAGENIHNIARNLFTGAAGVIGHPVKTLEGIGESVIHPIDALKSTYESLNTRPGETLSTMAGQAAATAGIGKAGEAVVNTVAKSPAPIARFLTRTTPEVTKDLVKATKEENVKATSKAAEETAKQQEKHTEKVADQEAKRKVDLRKHFDKTQATKEANTQAESAVSRKEALNRGVEQLDVKFKSSLESLRDKVNAQANAKYTALNSALDAEQANPEFLPNAIDEALQKIKGSDTEPTIIKDMSKKVERGEVSTYRDLQGYYSEIGRELHKGTLPGDVYAAYDTLQEAIGNEMQNVANRKGLGPQLTDARATWRQMKQTFYDPKSPIAKALKSTERGKAIAALSSADIAGIEALAKYDPELARMANTIRGYQAEAKAISAKPKALKSLPQLAPKPPVPEAPAPVQPELKSVGPEEIRGAKLKSLEQRAGKIRSRGEWIASGAAGYRALYSILHKHLGAVPADLLEGGLAIAGVEGISKLLENPKVVEFLTRPTASDLAQVPAELRGDMSQIAQIAAKKGIKVDPRIYAVAGASSQPKRVGAVLSK